MKAKHSAGFRLYHRPAHARPGRYPGRAMRAASLFLAMACLLLTVSVYPAAAATSMSSANRVLPLRGAPATNVAPSRSSTSIMSPQLSRTVRPRIAYHRPKPS